MQTAQILDDPRTPVVMALLEEHVLGSTFHGMTQATIQTGGSMRTNVTPPAIHDLASWRFRGEQVCNRFRISNERRSFDTAQSWGTKHPRTVQQAKGEF